MKPDIHAYIRPGARAHLVGVGGVSMSPLAEVLHGAGVVITGSDMNDSGTVERRCSTVSLSVMSSPAPP